MSRTDDMVSVVRCKDCIFWTPPQILLDDGSYRDYAPDEPEMVTIDVGINVGSCCALYDKHHHNDISHWMNEDDFCSKEIGRAHV